jgi:hypothetical protein
MKGKVDFNSSNVPLNCATQTPGKMGSTK